MGKLLLLGLLMCSLQVNAGDFNKKECDDLISVIKHNLMAMNSEDIDEYMKDIHPDSPAFANTKLILKQLFDAYDLKATHISLKPLMIDDSYFIVRAKQKTVKISGNALFQNNIADAIHVYKKYNGKWLLWSSMILEIKKIDK